MLSQPVELHVLTLLNVRIAFILLLSMVLMSCRFRQT